MTCRVRLGLLILIVPSLCRAQTPDERRATVRWLQLLQTEDGGFRSSPDASPQGSLRATSAAVRALKKFGGEPRHREAAARFVESCWNARTGTFGDRPGATGDVILTAVGLMAARELGLPMDRYRKAALSYLAANAREYEEVRMAAAGMEAAGEVSREAAASWIAELQAKANPDGSFGEGAEKARDIARVTMRDVRKLTGLPAHEP
jgi:prenyltransferase beta subunit